MKINDLAAGRAFRDAIPDGDDFRLRFADGLEIVIEWASGGPEVRSYRLGVITAERDLHPQFRYVVGKIVRQVLTDGRKLVIAFTDGHELRSDFRRAPAVEGVDVRLQLKPSGAVGLARL